MSRTKVTPNSIAAGAINANTILAADVVGPHAIANTSTYSVGELLVGGTILLDNTGVITGPSSITSTAFVGGLTGNVTGNASGTAATVTTAAQPAITSVGTLTALQVDNLNINTNTISATSGALNITPAGGSAIVLDGTVNVDAGVITGATSITSTAFVGALTGNVTGNASGTAATVTTAAQPAITSVGTLTSFRSTGIDDNSNALAMTIDSLEHVGIGTASPSEILHIVDGGGSDAEIILETSTNSTGSRIHLKSPNQTGSRYHTISSEYASTANWRIGGTGTDNAFDFAIGSGYTNVMRINATGVGIGTSAPGARLHIKQAANGTNNGFRTERSDTTAYGVIYMGGDDDLYIQNQANGDINWYTNAAAAMTLKPGGKLGIGASYNSAAGATLGLTNGGAEQLEFVLASNDVRMQVYDRTAGAYDNLDIDFLTLDLRVGTTPAISINSSGKVGIGTSSPTGKLQINGSDNALFAMRTTGDTASHVMGTQYLNNSGAVTAQTFATGDSSSGNVFRIKGIGAIDLIGGDIGVTGAAADLRVTSAGNVGIGAPIATTNAKLTVDQGTLAYTIDLVGQDSSDVASIRFINNAYSASRAELTAVAAGGLITSVSGSEKMRVTAAGSVGIGTHAPGQPLEVFTGNGALGIRINRYGAGVYYSDIVHADAPERLAFKVGTGTAIAERMAITGGGALTIGTTTALNGSLLTVAGSSITVGTTSHSDIYMSDSDNGQRRIHCNSDYVGFLNSSSGWGAGCHDNGTWHCFGALTVAGGAAITSSLTMTGRIHAPYGQSVGTLRTATGSLGGIEMYAGSSTNAAFLAFHRPGAFASYFGIDTDNYFAVGGWSYGAALGNFKCNVMSKASGSFRIDHPLPALNETHDLSHSFIEGPQADNLYRGKATLVDGTLAVNIDEIAGMTEGTFVLLNREVQCFTSNESDWDAVRGSVNGNILTIECQNQNSTAIISWLVIGERKDKHMYDTDWTDENGKVIVEPLKTASAVENDSNLTY